MAPSPSAVALPIYPLGGLRLLGLKTFPMFLHLLVISLFVFTVKEYCSPSLKPVKDTVTVETFEPCFWKNSIEPSRSSGTTEEVLYAGSGGLLTFE